MHFFRNIQLAACVWFELHVCCSKADQKFRSKLNNMQIIFAGEKRRHQRSGESRENDIWGGTKRDVQLLFGKNIFEGRASAQRSVNLPSLWLRIYGGCAAAEQPLTRNGKVDEDRDHIVIRKIETRRGLVIVECFKAQGAQRTGGRWCAHISFQWTEFGNSWIKHVVGKMNKTLSNWSTEGLVRLQLSDTCSIAYLTDWVSHCRVVAHQTVPTLK